MEALIELTTQEGQVILEITLQEMIQSLVAAAQKNTVNKGLLYVDETEELE